MENLEIVGVSGALVSPDYPGEYPNYAECTKTISVPENVVTTTAVVQADQSLFKFYFK